MSKTFYTSFSTGIFFTRCASVLIVFVIINQTLQPIFFIWLSVMKSEIDLLTRLYIIITNIYIF